MNQYNTDKQNLRIKFLMLGGLVNLVKKDYDATISDMEGKFSLLLMIITLQVVYLMSDFNKKLSTLAAKAELKAEQDDLIQVIFIGIFFFGGNGFQLMFVY